MEKMLSEITREEWIAFNWIECTCIGEERTMLAESMRTPDEAAKARDDWDSTAFERSMSLEQDE